jgi:outer membrane protein OmpA-like peptidoglycan-associated protein
MREKIAIALLCAAALSGCSTYTAVHDYVYGPPKVFIVFFPMKSADLTPDAVDIVKVAATQIQRQHPATVQIAAGVAAGGNMEMSAPRFAAVRQKLVDDGVPEDLIARSAIADPQLDTGPARQRVEIRLLANGP